MTAAPLAGLATLLLSINGWAASDFIKLVRKAETRKEPEERVEWFDRAIKAYEPSHGPALLANCHLRRGEARFELWDFALAEPDLSKALELDPGAVRALLLRGRARARLGRHEQAVADLREYTVARAEDIEGWLWLGETELSGGRPEAALAAFANAEQLDPSDHRPALGAARARMSRKDWKAAVERLDAAEKAAKARSPEVLAERAVCRVALGRHEQALGDYTGALPLFERRLEAMRRARAPQPALDQEQATLARAYYGRGRVLEFLVRMPQAAEDYAAACELGHKQGCARVETARAAPAPELAPPAAEPEPARPERPSKRRRVKTRVDDDAGDRIYAN